MARKKRKTKGGTAPLAGERGCSEYGCVDGGHSAAAGRAHCRPCPGKVRFHSCRHRATIASMSAFASSAACEELVALAEAVGFSREDSSYAQATEDLEVDACPQVRAWLQRQQLVDSVADCMWRTHGVAPTAFDDVSIVKYDARRQASLQRHTDAGDVSFMLALSSRSAYRGGGTAFDILAARDPNTTSSPTAHGQEGRKASAGDGVLHLDQGELLIFDAGLHHAGLPITSGTRYLLVGFCFAEAGATRVPGNVGLDLHRLCGSDSRFDLWRLREKAEYWKDGQLLAAAHALYRRQEAHPQLSSASCWVGATEPTERGSLASFAQDVFWFHARRLGLERSSAMGAEYWVQCLAAASSHEEPGSIPWHYDKDEGAMKVSGVVRHPAVATVTYLSTGGVPTVVFGERQTLVSFPRAGNHLAFAGNFLHGCPDVSIRGRAKALERLRREAVTGTTNSAARGQGKAREDMHGHRTTLLVNLWPGDPPDRSTFLEALPSSARLSGGAARRPGELGAPLVAWQEVRVEHPTLSDDGLQDPDDVLDQLSPAAGLLGQAEGGRGGGIRADALLLVRPEQ